jgi:two-component system, sensor histidine kinase and response regulator
MRTAPPPTDGDAFSGGSFTGEAAPVPPTISLRSIALPIAAVTLVIGALTLVGMGMVIEDQKQNETAQLQSIADLKVRQLAVWVQEKQSDARYLQTSPFFRDESTRLRTSNEEGVRQDLVERLTAYQSAYSDTVSAAFMLDEAGRFMLGTETASRDVPDVLRQEARDADADHKLRMVGPYLDSAGHPRLNFLIPVIAEEQPSGPQPTMPHASIVIEADIEQYLFPLMKSWPLPNTSGETLLFKRADDQVLFLNELRYRPGAAANFTIPVTQQAVLGAQILQSPALVGQLIEGVDYRGEPVMGVARPVPGTDWYLIAKIDKAEFYRSVVSTAFRVGLAGLFTLLAAAGALYSRPCSG